MTPANIGVSYVLADKLAALNPEVIELTQETTYLFFVSFILALQFWDNKVVKTSLATILLLCSVIRFLHFIAIGYLLRYLKHLSSQQKIQLLAAHESRSESGIRMILEEVNVHSAEQVAAHIYRQPLFRVARLTGQ